MTRLYPGIQIREIDKSDYVRQQASTVLGLVGVAAKGPMHVPTIVSDEQDFVNTFGAPLPLSAGQDEIQLLTVTGSPSGGTFKLTWNGQQTASIAYNASAATVQSALEALPAIGASNIAVTGGNGGPWTVQYVNNRGNYNQPQPTLSTNSLSGGSTPSVAITTLQAGVAPAGDFAGHCAINFLKRGRNLVFVRTSQYITGTGWIGATALTDAPGSGSPIYWDAGGLTGIRVAAKSPGDWGNDLAVRLTKVGGRNSNAVYTLSLVSSVSGTFTLTITATGISAQTTPSISWNSNDTSLAVGIQSALETIVGVGNVSVTVTSTKVFSITFQNTLGQQAVTLTGGFGSLSGGSPTCTSATTGGVPFPAETVYKLEVIAPVDQAGHIDVVETFSRVMFLNNDTLLQQYHAYWMSDAINLGVRNAFRPSAYISMTDSDFPATSGDITSEACTTAQAAAGGVTFTLSGGNSGTNTAAGTTADYATAYVGTQADTVYGITALQNFANPQTVDVNVLALPGVVNASALSQMISICETRQDAICIIDPPSGLDYRGVIDWHNKTGDHANDGFNPNSSYAALYWPWLQGYDNYNSENILYPPSVFIPAVYAQNDLFAAPWFAPAGIRRGGITLALGLESPTPSLGALESLYTGGNVVNVIQNFKQNGITVYGNKTTQRRSTLLDNISVRRGLLFIEKAVASAVVAIPFEPNDEQTQNEFIYKVKPVLDAMKGARGCTDFKIICDPSINTPDVVDQGILKGFILYKPMPTAERVLIDFTLLGTGASFNVSTVAN